MSKKKLSPTLWRTCRVLMNDVRLRLLWAVVKNNDKLNVTAIAKLLGIIQPHATIGLRALQSRGLIGVRRERYSVYYNLNEDQSLPEATRLRNAFAKYFDSQELEHDWTIQVMILLKAFSHFNRLAMIRRLAEGETTKAELEKAAGVVVKTIEHHLRILTRAGLIERRDAEGEATYYRLVPQTNPIARELLHQTIGGELTYFNRATGCEKDLRLIHDKDGNKGFVKLDTRPIFD